MKRNHKLAGAALAALLVTGATAASADVLILRSVGPSAGKYPAGQRLPDNARLNLKPGDTVAVLRGSGTRIFRGPGSYPLDAAPVRTTGEARGARSGIGAVRGDASAADAVWPANLWQVNAAESGTACFVAGWPVTLWRRDAGRRAQVSVMTAAGATTRLDWPAGAETLQLPTTASADRSRITYAPAGAGQPTRVTLARLEIDPSNREAVGQALLGRRCHLQLQHFIALNEEGAG
jgi:hypothetical protein